MQKDQIVEKKEEKNKVKQVLTIVGNVLFYAVIGLLFIFSIMNIQAGDGSQSFPNIFGKGFLSVQTTSMQREEGGYTPAWWSDETKCSIQAINKGDLVYVNVYNKDKDELKVGDVVAFYDSQLDSLVTHRIVSVSENSIQCQGDWLVTSVNNDDYAFDIDDPKSAKNAALSMKVDGSNYPYIQAVSKDSVKGIVTGIASGAGYALDNVRQNWLFYFVIPVAVVLVLELFFVFKNIMDLRNEKAKAAVADDKEAMMAELELEKERMRQELLAELKAQQAAENNDEPKVEETVIEETIEEAPVEEPVVEETVEEVVEETVESENETEEKTEE